MCGGIQSGRRPNRLRKLGKSFAGRQNSFQAQPHNILEFCSVKGPKPYIVKALNPKPQTVVEGLKGSGWRPLLGVQSLPPVAQVPEGLEKGALNPKPLNPQP